MSALLKPSREKAIILALIIVLFDYLYFYSAKKFAFLYLINTDINNFEDILNFQLVISFSIFPLFWIFIVALIHLSSEVFGGEGQFKLLLYQVSFIFAPLIIIFIIMSFLLLEKIEGDLIWRITKFTSRKEISDMILSSLEMKILRASMVVIYVLSLFWIISRVNSIYKLNYVMATLAVVLPFVTIYLISILIKASIYG
jgi:hypothetical protein